MFEAARIISRFLFKESKLNEEFVRERVSIILTELQRHNSKIPNLDEFRVVINEKAYHSEVQMNDGVLEIIINSLDKSLKKVDHEIGHAIDFNTLGGLRPKEKLPDNKPEFRVVVEYLKDAAANEIVAMLTEYVFAENKADTDHADFVANKKKYPNSSFPAFDIFYTSPGHAMGHTVLEKLRENIEDDELIKLLASLIGQETNQVMLVIKKLLSDDYQNLEDAFEKGCHSFYKSYY